MEILQTPVSQFGSDTFYDWLAGASNYENLVNSNISAYAFRTRRRAAPVVWRKRATSS